jgi:hypothetical protein
MIRKLLCATLAVGTSVAMLAGADAFTGTWKLDLARSTFASDNPSPRDATLTFTEPDGNRAQAFTRIAADGTQTVTEWSAPMAGGLVTFPAGQGPNGGAALAVVDGRTLVMKQTLRNGRAGASRTYQISADGRTLALTQIREDGKEMARMVFSR